MLRCCIDCPNNSESLKNYLNNLLKDYDNDEKIQFSQWINDDRINIQTITLPAIDEYNEYQIVTIRHWTLKKTTYIILSFPFRLFIMKS